jgi:phosphatidylglycerol:prolipoprotein diacylglycerol transferase
MAAVSPWAWMLRKTMTIGLDPYVVSIGPLLLGWVNLFTLAGVTLGVVLALRWAKAVGVSLSAGYGVALRAVVWGLVAARLFHVADYWGFYSAVPWRTLDVVTGGLSLWGAILGGAVGAAVYAHRVGLPVRLLADAAALAALVAQALGRVGELLAGELMAKATALPWGITYTHPGSVSYGTDPVRLHPVALYEMLWDAALLAVLWRYRRRLRPDGALFVAYLAGYAAGRSAISFARLDPVLVLGLQQAQVVGLAVLAWCGYALWRWHRQRIGEFFRNQTK